MHLSHASLTSQEGARLLLPFIHVDAGHRSSRRGDARRAAGHAAPMAWRRVSWARRLVNAGLSESLHWHGGCSQDVCTRTHAGARAGTRNMHCRNHRRQHGTTRRHTPRHTASSAYTALIDGSGRAEGGGCAEVRGWTVEGRGDVWDAQGLRGLAVRAGAPEHLDVRPNGLPPAPLFPTPRRAAAPWPPTTHRCAQRKERNKKRR